MCTKTHFSLSYTSLKVMGVPTEKQYKEHIYIYIYIYIYNYIHLASPFPCVSSCILLHLAVQS